MAEKDRDKDPLEPVLCNLYNPTRGRRVIFDGLKGMKAITIDSGDTKYNVTLSKQIIEELRDRNRIEKNSDLVPGPATDAPPVQLTAQQKEIAEAIARANPPKVAAA